jgi:outer membrane immunogenic protein
MKITAILRCLTAIALMAGTAHAENANQSPPWDTSHPYNWQGVFVGFNAGVGWGNDSSKEYNTGGAPTDFSAGFDQTGGITGFTAGYNVPLGQNVIFGADADFDTANLSGGYRRLSNGNGDDVKYDWISSLRARLGVPINNILPYVAGGFTMADIKDDFIQGNANAQDLSTTRFGWTVGAGLEYGLPENFTARLDYRFTEFASYNQTPSTVLPGFFYKQQPRLNEVTAGISYYFK